MRCRVLLVALALGLVAQAGTCVWTGGSGRWSDPANWRDGTLPVAGDTVYVSNTVANITINLDTAGISIASIRFEGEGPVEVVGEALTLTSDWYLKGTGVNNVMDYPNSRLPWFTRTARVTCRVPLTLNTSGAGTGVCSCFNDMVFEKSIEIVGTKTFYVHSGYNPSAAEKAEGVAQAWRNVTFRGPITGAGTTFRAAQYPNGIVYAYGPINVKHMWVSGWATGRLCLGSNSNSWETIRTDYNNRYLALVEGAFPTNSIFELDSTYLSSTGYFNLGNYDTTIDRLNDPAAALAMHAGNSRSGWVRSASTIDCDAGSTFAPVTLTLKGTADGCSAIGFADAVSLVWDPVGDFTQTLTGRVSSTTGAISVKRGTLEFASGTSFPNVKRYSIASGAKLKLAADVAVSAPMVFVGDSYVPNGVYSGVAAEGVTQVDWLVGAGTLTVDTGTAAVWKTAVSGNWEDAANWLSGEVPTSTSDVYLVIPSAGDYTVKVNTAIPAFPARLTMNNAGGGRTTLEFAADATQSKGCVAIGVGGRVLVDEGVQFLYRGIEPEAYSAMSWTQRNYTLKTNYTFAVAGGEWLNNGGTTVITNFAGTFSLSGTAAQKGRLTVRGGLLRYADLETAYPLTVSKGGRLDVQDAELYLPHYGNNHLTDLAVAGGEVVISNSAVFAPKIKGGSISFGSGTTTFSGSSTFQLYGGNHFVKPGQAGETAKILFTDNAAIKSDFLTWYLGLMAGGRAEMVYASTNLTAFPIAVGVDAGTGVFTVPVQGKVRIHSHGLFVGSSSQAALSNELPTTDGVEGFVEVDGYMQASGSFHPGWAAAHRPAGLAVGYGGYTAVTSGRPYVGHMTVRGTYTQEAGHAVIGGGYASGDFTQAGGTSTFFTYSTTEGQGGANAASLLVGLAGGAGRFVVSNGTVTVKNGNVYVGGCDTNHIYMCSKGETFLVGSTLNTSSTSWAEKGFPADSLDGEGTFSMAGGSFTAQHTFTVGAFGSGTVEMIGSAPKMTVKDLVLSNNVASTVRYVADANGFAPITVQDSLTIADGAALEVDFSAYEGTGVKFPLFTFGTTTGTIAPEHISVTGLARRTPCVLQNTGTGLTLVFSRGTQIIFR